MDPQNYPPPIRATRSEIMRRTAFCIAAFLTGAPSLAWAQPAHAFRPVGVIDNGGQVGFVDTLDVSRSGPLVIYSELWVYTPAVTAGHSVVAYVVRRDEDDCANNTRRQVYSALYDSRGDLLKAVSLSPPPTKVSVGGNAEVSHRLVCSTHRDLGGESMGTLSAALALADKMALAVKTANGRR